MFQLRQVLVRLGVCDAAREVARSGLLGRVKVNELPRAAQAHGWLDAAAARPGDEALAEAMTPRKRSASNVSSVEPLRSVVQGC